MPSFQSPLGALPARFRRARLLILGCGKNSLRLIPPLVVSRAEIDEALEIVDHVLGLAEAEAGLA